MQQQTDGNTKQVLAMVYTGIMLSKIDFACMSNETLKRLINNVVTTSCDIVDALEAEFVTRKWDSKL